MNLRAAGPWHTGVIYAPPRDDAKLVKGAWVFVWPSPNHHLKIRKIFPAVKRKGRLSRARAWLLYKNSWGVWRRKTEYLDRLWPVEALEGWTGLPPS